MLPNVWLLFEKTGIVGSVVVVGVAVGDTRPVGVEVLVGWDVAVGVGVAVGDTMPVGAEVLVGWDVAVGVGSVFPQPASRVRKIITVAMWRAVRPWTIRPI